MNKLNNLIKIVPIIFNMIGTFRKRNVFDAIQKEISSKTNDDEKIMFLKQLRNYADAYCTLLEDTKKYETELNLKKDERIKQDFTKQD